LARTGGQGERRHHHHGERDEQDLAHGNLPIVAPGPPLRPAACRGA
jgi:hypothetical protein